MALRLFQFGSHTQTHDRSLLACTFKNDPVSVVYSHCLPKVKITPCEDQKCVFLIIKLVREHLGSSTYAEFRAEVVFAWERDAVFVEMQPEKTLSGPKGTAGGNTES